MLQRSTRRQKRLVDAHRVGARPSRAARARRSQFAVILVLSIGAHGLLALWLAQTQKPPRLAALDGASDKAALSVALVSSAELAAPASGATTSTEDASPVADASGPAALDQAPGIGSQPSVAAGGQPDPHEGMAADTNQAGGSGAPRDDIFARASLASSGATLFDLKPPKMAMMQAAATGAAIWPKIAPCWSAAASAVAASSPPAPGAVAASGAIIQVSLDPTGQVASAKPVRSPSGAGATQAEPTPPEARAIAAIRACAPYRDLALPRQQVVAFPPTASATAAASSPATLSTSPVLRS